MVSINLHTSTRIIIRDRIRNFLLHIPVKEPPNEPPNRLADGALVAISGVSQGRIEGVGSLLVPRSDGRSRRDHLYVMLQNITYLPAVLNLCHEPAGKGRLCSMSRTNGMGPKRAICKRHGEAVAKSSHYVKWSIRPLKARAQPWGSGRAPVAHEWSFSSRS